jgi:PAS domain S-box-containing protein
MRGPAPATGGEEEAAIPILIVDDNSAKRLALRAILAPLGYSIVEADSGIAALRCVMAQQFAVILLDVRMSGIDGFETAALIRQRRESEMTAIIFITSYTREEIPYADLYAEGVVDFIFAPVAADQLRAKVQVFAKLFRRADELATGAADVQRFADDLKLLTDAAPIGIFQTDAENRYVYTNPRWSEITGVAAEDAAGRGWDMIVGPEDRERLNAALPAGTTERLELCQRFTVGASDAMRVVLVTSKAVPGPNGGVAGWVGTLADVTIEAEAKAALSSARDAANEASQLKSDFLANMSHEIRTPMNGVIGMTDLLLETELDPRQRAYVKTVSDSGKALLTIIDNILDFSQVEAGAVGLENVAFELHNVVEDVMDLLAPLAQNKGLELVTFAEAAVPSMVRADPGRLRQVLMNLVGNAIKFTHSGEVVVTLGATRGSDDDDLLIRFEVSDTGDGIEADKLERIFDPFVQADASTSRKYGGTGLGLAISARLVALMGGTSGATSQTKKGSTFWFTIRAEAAVGQQRAASRSPLAGVHALLVEGNAAQKKALARSLTDWGMRVTVVDSAAAALAALRLATTGGSPFRVALVDDALPDKDGMALATAVAADYTLATPVVLMTHVGREHVEAAARASGVFRSLAKPVRRAALRSSLTAAVDTHAAPPTIQAPRPAAIPSARQPAALGRLLLAEDNLVNQQVAVAMLGTAGYKVDTVLNGADAVEAAAGQPYDAILMDCQMPELNGYDATAAIRAREGGGSHTPIIAMTAGARNQDRERCLAAGMDAYVSKPVNKETLLAIVASAIGRVGV